MSTKLLDLSYFDSIFDQPTETHRPEMLFVCTTPRSGSHRLNRALYHLGLGVPAEYFNPAAIILRENWGLEFNLETQDGLASYWRELLRRRSRNGVFVMSLFGSQLRLLRRVLSAADRAVFIHLHRADTAGQIASLLALYETKQPGETNRSFSQIPGIREVSPRAIRILDQWIRHQNDKWHTFLADKPHVDIATETFLADPAGSLRKILALHSRPVALEQFEKAVAGVAKSHAYATNATIKQRLLRDFALVFAQLPDRP